MSEEKINEINNRLSKMEEIVAGETGLIQWIKGLDKKVERIEKSISIDMMIKIVMAVSGLGAILMKVLNVF